ncbi:hypothetical protein ACP179_10195 [Xenorhabdus stockiae]|uniref:hypothetical protein n=1 Tax=Xenorhabdus stockiae TaxID=351614 RepID=UPI003CF40683
MGNGRPEQPCLRSVSAGRPKPTQHNVGELCETRRSAESFPKIRQSGSHRIINIMSGAPAVRPRGVWRTRLRLLLSASVHYLGKLSANLKHRARRRQNHVFFSRLCCSGKLPCRQVGLRPLLIYLPCPDPTALAAPGSQSQAPCSLPCSPSPPRAAPKGGFP